MRYLLLFLWQGWFLSATCQPSTPQKVALGHLPVVQADAKGTMHLVYGLDSTIYYTTANSSTDSFKLPTRVATLSNLVAGAKRGPQLAITDQFIVITAVNRQGDIYAYSLNQATNQWSPAVRVNDVPEIAKEGFQAIAGSGNGLFHAAWLDLRDDKKNKIVGASSRDGGRTWSKNQVIYRSPDGAVCECCKVSLAAKNNDVYVQFRNWLGGSRDLHLIHSTDGGKTYAPAQKLGTGTWKLTACPMDGGAVVLSAAGQPITAWRRENNLYTCLPGEPEQSITTGRNITLAAGTAQPVLAWDEGGIIWVKSAANPTLQVGKGQMPSIAVAGQTVMCVWESEGQVMMATTNLRPKP
ncbi:exo-alpha-sialidase (plasmid) [Fibrella sp. USSR17]